MKEANKIIYSADKEKLTEKAFVRSIIVSVLSILLCMTALCSTTWAWYSKNISSTSNTVYAANCDMSISVQRIDGEDYFYVEKSDGRYQLKNLEKGVEYKISLEAVGNANSAYAIINYNGDTYYTDQFKVFSDSSTAEEFTFILSFSEENISIEIYPCWGTSSRGIRDVYNEKSYSDLLEITKDARTTQTPVTTAPATTETPVTTATTTTEAPVTAASATIETTETTAPVTTQETQTPQTTASVTTEAPEMTASVTTEAPETIASVTTETPETTAPVTTQETQTPETTALETTQETQTPQTTTPETTQALETK